MILEYKTIHILLNNVHLYCRGGGGGGGGGSSNRNTSRDESVETGDEYVEAGDESIVEAGEKTQQSCYNGLQLPFHHLTTKPRTHTSHKFLTRM